MAYVLISLGRCRICMAVLVFMVMMPFFIFFYMFRGFIGVKMVFNATGNVDYQQLISVFAEKPVILDLGTPMVRSYVDFVLLLVFLMSGFYAIFALGSGIERGYAFLDMVAAGGRLQGLARIMLHIFAVFIPASMASGSVLLLVLRVLLGLTCDTSPAFWGVLRASIAGFLTGTTFVFFTGDRGLALFSLLAFTSALTSLDSFLNLGAGKRFFTALFALPGEDYILAYPLLICVLVALIVWGAVRLEVRG